MIAMVNVIHHVYQLVQMDAIVDVIAVVVHAQEDVKQAVVVAGLIVQINLQLVEVLAERIAVDIVHLAQEDVRMDVKRVLQDA